MNKIPAMPLWFTLGGAIPFILFTLLLWFDSAGLALWIQLLETYAVIILVFVAGIDWGFATTHYPERGSRLLMCWSVLPALVIWIAMSSELYTLLGITTGIYILQWVANLIATNNDLCPRWYLKLRSIITVVVIVAMIFACIKVYS